MVRKSTVPEHDEKRGKNMELSIGRNIQNKRTEYISNKNNKHVQVNDSIIFLSTQQ